MQTKEHKSYIAKPSKKYLQANTKRTKLGQAGSSQWQVLEFPAGHLGYRLQIDDSNHACEHETNLIVSETLVKFVSNASQLGVLVTAYSFLDCFESVPRYSKQNRHSLMVEFVCVHLRVGGLVFSVKTHQSACFLRQSNGEYFRVNQ